MERFWAQRERLLRATAIAHLEGAASVTRVTALSGVGRTTFYECFDDFEHALEALRREELQRVRRGLSGLHADSARGEGVAGLCRAWLELIAAQPIRALVALEPARGEQGSPLVTVFREVLARLWASPGEEGAQFHAAVCAEASGRSFALALLASPQGSATSSWVAGGDSPAPAAAADLARSVRRLVGA